MAYGKFERYYKAKRDAKKSIEKEKTIYEAIKAEPELAPKSVKLATRSIVFSVLSMVAVILTALGIYLIASQPFEQILLKIILIPAVIITCFYFMVFFFVKAVVNLVFQFRLNKTRRAWVAFALLFLPAILFIVSIILLVGILI